MRAIGRTMRGVWLMPHAATTQGAVAFSILGPPARTLQGGAGDVQNQPVEWS
jgi:hypothetical protein